MSSAATGTSEVGLHLRFGWSALFVFALLGSLLEALHGLKIGFYLDLSNETRRLMWTLAHAHGTLLALVNVAFAYTLGLVEFAGNRLRLASRTLIAATVVMPAGFWLGGLDIRGGDPGLGVILAPVGSLLLLIAVFVTAQAAIQTRRG